MTPRLRFEEIIERAWYKICIDIWIKTANFSLSPTEISMVFSLGYVNLKSIYSLLLRVLSISPQQEFTACTESYARIGFVSRATQRPNEIRCSLARKSSCRSFCVVKGQLFVFQFLRLPVFDKNLVGEAQRWSVNCCVCGRHIFDFRDNLPSSSPCYVASGK